MSPPTDSRALFQPAAADAEEAEPVGASTLGAATLRDSGVRIRDSVDRYLDDLDATDRITPAEEITLAEALFDAALACWVLGRKAGVSLERPDAVVPASSRPGVEAALLSMESVALLSSDEQPASDAAESAPSRTPISDRDAVIQGVGRMCRLMDEHFDASADPRRKGMVRMLEEELTCDADGLRALRLQMAEPRRRGLEARHAMTRANLALVVHVAKSYCGRGVAMADLIQEGNIALLRAVEKFDPTRGVRLGTYATAWLHRTMRRTVRSLSRTVRLPESAKNARSQSVPIDTPVGEERLSLTDVLCEDDAIAPDDMAVREQIRARARMLLATLSAQEALIIAWRFGIERPEAVTLREVGEHLGITRERVRQIEKVALDKLRRRMKALA